MFQNLLSTLEIVIREKVQMLIEVVQQIKNAILSIKKRISIKGEVSPCNVQPIDQK